MTTGRVDLVFSTYGHYLAPMKHSTHTYGFTLLELMVVLSIVSIISLMAMPDSAQYRNDNRLRAATNDLVVAMQAARSEAVGRNVATTLCKKNVAGTDCSADGGWHQGWLIFVDPDQDASVDVGEEVIKVHEPLGGLVTFYGTTGVADSITFRASGQTSVGSTQTLIICDENGFSAHSKGMIVTILGRASVMSAPDTGQTDCLEPGV
jgi:type IV fimbrial biogenesis protein FimT